MLAGCSHQVTCAQLHFHCSKRDGCTAQVSRCVFVARGRREAGRPHAAALGSARSCGPQGCRAAAIRVLQRAPLRDVAMAAAVGFGRRRGHMWREISPRWNRSAVNRRRHGAGCQRPYGGFRRLRSHPPGRKPRCNCGSLLCTSQGAVPSMNFTHRLLHRTCPELQPLLLKRRGAIARAGSCHHAIHAILSCALRLLRDGIPEISARLRSQGLASYTRHLSGACNLWHLNALLAGSNLPLGLHGSVGFQIG